MGWPQRSSSRRRRRIGGVKFPITINFDGDEATFFNGGWAEAGGNVTNDQIALGAELWDAAAAVFTSGTYAWAAQGSNTQANVSNALDMTWVDNQLGSKELLNNAADLSSDLTVDQWYSFLVDAKVNVGAVNILLNDGVTNFLIPGFGAAAFAQKLATFRARHATNANVSGFNMGTGEVLTIDNLSLKPFTFSSLLNPLKSSFGLADGFFIDIYINSVTGVSQVGALWNYDGANNFGMAYMDGTNLRVDKNVAGTYTNLASVAQAVTPDQILRIENPVGTNVLDILYNGVSKATPTIADAGIISNAGIALFSTEANNAISKVVIGQL